MSDKKDSYLTTHHSSLITLLMATSRIDIFRMMLQGDPDNTVVWFGLAKECEKAGRPAEVVEALTEYLGRADDEGNAYGMLARAYTSLGNREAARRAYQR